MFFGRVFCWGGSLKSGFKFGISEVYWVLFRFLYGGQFSGPVLIIVCDEFLGGGVAEGFMESGIVSPVNPVQGAPLNLGA